MDISLRAANGQYVCAEGGGGQAVVANRSAVGAWETFKLNDLGNGNVTLQAANGQYVCAEGGGGQAVVANRAAAGPWETFKLIDKGNGNVALQAANGQYVCAEGGGGQAVVANRGAVGPWETFKMDRKGAGASSNYDLAVSMDEATLNRALATLYARPALKSKLFSGTQTMNLSGADVTVGWDVLQSPVLNLNAPSADQWKNSIKEDGQTTPEPTQNAFLANFPQLKVTRTKTTGETDEATIPVTAICTINIRNNMLTIDPVSVVVDVSQAAKLDQLLYKKVIVPKVLKMADTLLTDEQIPNFKFQGVKFGEVVLAVGNGRITGLANMEGKPKPSGASTGDLPGGAFYILLSREALERVTSVGTQALTGRTIDKSGRESFGIGSAEYNARIRLDRVTNAQVSNDYKAVSVAADISVSANAGINVSDIVFASLTSAANTVASGATSAANTVASGATSAANAVAETFSSY